MLQDATAYAHELHGTPVPEARGAEWVHYLLRRPTGPLNAATDPGAGIQVYVNQGRWIAECPDCHGAQLACRTDERFLCNECGNIAIGNEWRPVDWPGNIEAIEAMLADRPTVNQNWLPGESVEILAMDNLVNMGRIR